MIFTSHALFQADSQIYQGRATLSRDLAAGDGGGGWGGSFFSCMYFNFERIIEEFIKVLQMGTNLINCNKLIYIDPGYHACRTFHDANLI